MSDVKISELPAVGAITGDELLPLVQDNETKKATVSGIWDALPSQDYEAISVSSAGNTEVTIPARCKIYTVRITVEAGMGTYTRNIDLTVSDRVAGDKAIVILGFAASVNPTIHIRDNTIPATIYTESGTGLAFVRQVSFTWNGTAWESDQG